MNEAWHLSICVRWFKVQQLDVVEEPRADAPDDPALRRQGREEQKSDAVLLFEGQ